MVGVIRTKYSNYQQDILELTNMTTAIWDDQEKPGILPPESGWDYDENLLEYDSDEDPETELSVAYDGEGTTQVWTNENES